MPRIALLGRETLSSPKKNLKTSRYAPAICSKKKSSKIPYVHLWQNGLPLNPFKPIFTILEPTIV